MSTRTNKKTFLFWALLLIPSIIIVGVSFQLVRHEQDRINASAVSIITERASAIADYIQITIQDVKKELTESLLEVPVASISTVLPEWSESNPLVRNVFIWGNDTENKLLYPSLSNDSTNEEQRFIFRYEAFFSANRPWDPDHHSSYNESKKMNPPTTISPDTFIDKLNSFNKERSQLRDLAKVKSNPSKNEVQSDGSLRQSNNHLRPDKKSGWVTWFTENRLSMLGWVQPSNTAPVYGIELELITIISRLITQLPSLESSGGAYTLVDGNGTIVHQEGRLTTALSDVPHISIPLSEALPHWQLNVYTDTSAFSSRNGYLYMACLLLTIFIIAILSGGILLTRESQRHFNDALQKTSFVSSVSHELKTPLTSIRMYAELLQSGRVKAPDKKKHYLSVIVTESQRLTRLVNNILDFGRLEEGKKKYRSDRFDLGDLIREIISTHTLRIENAGIVLTLRVPEPPAVVTTDRDAIEQVLLNLIDNGIKYAASGKKIILIIDNSNAEFFKISICDHGPGIPSDQREKIFDKFHRIDNSLTSDQPGSGLGLSIARHILRDLGGDLYYKQDDKYGSCFIINIRKTEL